MTNGQSATTQNTARLALCFIVWVALWFALPGHRDLIDPDESRYAEIPREMLATGDWITPRLNDLAYFEKPPLQYWATALIYKVSGVSEATARLWILLAGCAGALWTGYVASVLYGKHAGLFALSACSSGLLYFTLSHFLTLDLTLALCLALGVGALVLAQRQRDNAQALRRWMLCAWLALAGGFLTKGLVALVLPGGAVLLYSLWQRDWLLWRHLHLGKGLLLVALLCAPWFVLMQQRHPGFLEFFFVHEHFERYTTNTNHHEAPVWFFTLVFLAGALPWTASIVRGLCQPGFDFRRGDGSFSAERFLWSFIVVTIVFFSLSGSKLPAYVLPALPVAVLLAARHVAGGMVLAADIALAALVGALLVVLAALLPRFQARAALDILLTGQPWLFAAGSAFLTGALLAFLRRTRPAEAVIALTLSAVLGLHCVLAGLQALAPLRSSKEVAAQIRALSLPAGTPVFMVDEYTPSLPFYLQQAATLVVARSELGPGIDAEPWKWIESPEKFAERWHNERLAVAVIANEDFDTYDRLAIPMHMVYRGARDTVVVKPPELP